ncbi:MAG: tRNA (adenosine(37)-N6)-threonylcarbamoyltransferase complex ATPase subunit type 1 TsaE [Candidatus Saccharimonadales bacterium]
MIWQTSSTSSAETERLGELLGKQLKGGEVIELRSDLGGGKTTFIRGLVRGSGSQANVASPTFTLSRIYPGEKFDIHHFDFYRLNDVGILADQLAESLSDSKAVVAVEWADIVKDVLPPNHISIKLSPVAHDSDERQINIKYPQSAEPIVAAVETEWQDSQP